MIKSIVRNAGFWIFLAIPITSTIYITVERGLELTLYNLWATHISNPRLWVLDVIMVSYAMLTYIFKRQQIKQLKTYTRTERSLVVYRFVGLGWGILVYAICSLAIIYYDSGGITVESFVYHHLHHPIVIGLLTAIPFFFSLGYIIEKMRVTFEENLEKSAEIEKRNFELRKEILIRKHHEAELLEAKKQALAGEKAKEQFLSNMSHEIRTPMNGVVGLIHLLQDQNLTEEQRKYTTAIEYSAKNLMVLINQILDLSKINSEKLSLEYINFDIWETIQAAGATLSATASEKGIILRTIIDPTVPKWASGDPVRLNQILLNLMGNAIKFTEEGGVDLIVESKETDDGPRLSIHINDTGIGIPKDKLSDIFESFTQASTQTARLYGGSGLGLAISKELIELFGGAITVESEVEKGTSFIFDLQLKPATESLPQIIEENPSVKGSNFDPKSVKILMAEDNKINQLFAKAVLEKEGFQVDIAFNGQEVIERIYEKQYDVILMDVQMPIMNGIDATRFIRNATEAPTSEVKIIALTASAMLEDVEKCYQAGMDDHLPKPFKPNELIKILHKHFASPKVGS